MTYNADGVYVNGKPVIGTNRLCYVGQSLYSSGQSMGEQIKLAVPGGGDIVIFIAGRRDGQHPATVRRRGVGARQQLHRRRDRDRRRRSPWSPRQKAYLNAHKSSLKGAFAVDSGDTEYLGAQLKSLGMTIPAGGFDTTGHGARHPGRHARLHHLPGPVPAGLPAGALPVPVQPLRRRPGAAGHRHRPVVGHEVQRRPYIADSRYQGSTTAQKYISRPSGAINNPMATTST